ncbi:hypothetical protein GJ744_010576 [Endocarpon pusillum]|uniref:Uncharacterized protein n=1 Tax=Endocarpon pusillum TaxID=364733 RepID=A0A8H7APQ5_9EURO|nr:hypothetical protein GJ744_010576 [Endocarpon pusillum]
MSSKLLSQHPVIGPSTFPLSKFSFATVSGELVKPIPWTHIPDKGHLYAVFETVAVSDYSGRVDEKGQFKVLAEPEVLEDLDLKALGREAVNAAHEMKTLSPPSKFPTVTIIIQEPCIAVRFPLQYGQIRRFQMKFRLASDFYKALALFSQAGCPFTQAGALAAQPPMARPFSASSVAVPASRVCQSMEAPKSASSTADSDQSTLVPSLDLSRQSSSRPSTTSSTNWKSGAAVSKDPTLTYDMSRGPAYSEKPAVSQYFPSSRLSSAISSTVHYQHEKSSTTQGEAPRNSTLPFASDPITAGTSTARSSRNSGSQLGHGSIASRPSTAPTLESQRISQMLPPKRELPFQISRATSEASRNITRSDLTSSSAKAGSSDNANTSGTPRQPGAKGATKTSRATRDSVSGSRSCRKPAVPENDSPVPSARDSLRRSQRLSHKQAGINRTDTESTKISAPLKLTTKDELRQALDAMGCTKAIARSKDHAEQPEQDLAAPQYTNIDTQDLLARIDERQRLQRSKRSAALENCGDSTTPPSKRIATSVHPDLAAIAPPSSGVSMPVNDLPRAATGSGSRHLGDSSLGTTPALPRALDVNAVPDYDCQENGGLPPSAQKPAGELPMGPSDRRVLGSSERQALADISSNVGAQGKSHLVTSDSMRALMNDPNFAKSPEIAQWADLPPNEREAALETWMCQQLESESFVTLLKILEGMWQRLFFGR